MAGGAGAAEKGEAEGTPSCFAVLAARESCAAGPAGVPQLARAPAALPVGTQAGRLPASAVAVPLPRAEGGCAYRATRPASLSHWSALLTSSMICSGNVAPEKGSKAMNSGS